MDGVSIWNQRYVPCPPAVTVSYTRECLIRAIDGQYKDKFMKHKNFQVADEDLVYITPEEWLTNFTSLITKLEQNLTSVESTFDQEIYSLFSYIYQRGDLKKEKFMHALKKVRRCLKRWTEMKLKNLISNLSQMTPKEFYFIKNIRLPTPRYYHYVLHRMIGSFFLLLKCVAYCMEASVYLRSKMTLGHSLAICTLGYGMMGRIRACALDLLQSIAMANDELHPYVMSLLSSSSNDLGDVNFPSDLMKELEKENSQVYKNEPKQKKSKRGWLAEEKEIKNTDTAIYDEQIDMTSDDKQLEPQEDIKQMLEKAHNSDENLSNKSQGFTFSISNLKEEEEDLGEQITYSKFETLKSLSDTIIEVQEPVKKHIKDGEFGVGKLDGSLKLKPKKLREFIAPTHHGEGALDTVKVQSNAVRIGENEQLLGESSANKSVSERKRKKRKLANVINSNDNQTHNKKSVCENKSGKDLNSTINEENCIKKFKKRTLDAFSDNDIQPQKKIKYKRSMQVNDGNIQDSTKTKSSINKSGIIWNSNSEVSKEVIEQKEERGQMLGAINQKSKRSKKKRKKRKLLQENGASDNDIHIKGSSLNQKSNTEDGRSCVSSSTDVNASGSVELEKKSVLSCTDESRQPKKKRKKSKSAKRNKTDYNQKIENTGNGKLCEKLTSNDIEEVKRKKRRKRNKRKK